MQVRTQTFLQQNMANKLYADIAFWLYYGLMNLTFNLDLQYYFQYGMVMEHFRILENVLKPLYQINVYNYYKLQGKITYGTHRNRLNASTIKIKTLNFRDLVDIWTTDPEFPPGKHPN